MATINLITFSVLAGCIGILQWHGIQFWSAHVDPATGWAWSLTLEGAGLWLWWTGRRALGFVASVLLLIGPLYVVSVPLLGELGRAEHQDSARSRLIPAEEARVASLERELAAFLANSRERAGWLQPIEAAQSRLAVARADLGRLYAERPESSGPGWRTRSVIVLQALALCLFQVSAVFGICELAKFRPAKPVLDIVGAALVAARCVGQPQSGVQGQRPPRAPRMKGLPWAPVPPPVNGKKRGLGPKGMALLSLEH